MVRIYIQLIKIEVIGQVLTGLGELLNQDSQLREQVIRDGLIFKKISSTEFKLIQEGLRKLNFLNYTFVDSQLSLRPSNGDTQGLINLIFVLLRQNSEIIKILWNKFIVINNLDSEKAKEIQKYLGSKGAKVIIEEEQPQRYVVQGSVIQGDNIPLSNIIVRAFDWDSQGEEFLGITLTDSDGNYQIAYTNEKFSRFETEGSGPDLIVRAYNKQGEILASSPRKNNSQLEETIDLTVTDRSETIFTVQGTIRQDYGNFPLSNMRVIAVDQCVGEEQKLGEAVTDKNGKYTIHYSLISLNAKGKDAPDILIKVISREEQTDILAVSATKYDASKQEIIDVLVPTEKLKQPDEYQRISEDLLAQCGNQLENRQRFAQLQENDQRQDITYLANKTGWDARMVAMVALADQFSEKSKIPSEFYYALFRAGIAANDKVLNQIQPEVVQDLWNQAADEKIIPENLKGKISENIERFKAYATGQLLNQSATIGVSSLKELLDVSLGTDENRKQRFAQLYYENKNDSDRLWQKVSEEFGQETSDRLQLEGKLSFLTINNSKLIGKLHQNQNLQNPIDLVRSGLYQRDRWDELLSDDIAIPQEIPGEDAAEKKANYADFMVNQLKLSYPTTIVAEKLNNNEIPLQTDNVVKANVYQFLTEQQEQFELGIHPVEDYLQKRNLNLADETLTQVKRLQRVYQISPSDEAMGKLLEGNLDSAYAVVQYNEREFVQQFQSSLGGAATAKLIYAKAHQVHHSVLNIASTYLLNRLAPQIYALPLALKTPEDTGVIAYPTLEELFGEMDYCACEHCRSMLSPAAYLVDLLQFIDPPENGTQKPINVLLNRRPDIQHLQLTCENTNTILPYIDLVNEILEHFVVNGVENGNFSLENFQGFNIEGEITTEELLANPKFVNATAYQQLKQEVFPLLLPFHQPLEALRQYFDRFEVPLHFAMKQLRQNNNLDPSDDANPTDYAWRDILIERLQLSRQEYAVLTDRTISLQKLYGEDPNLVNETALIDRLSNVKNFAQKVNISYEELLELVQTQFINPHSDLIPKLEKLGIDFLTLTNFTEGRISETDFDALLPDDLNLNQYGGDVKKWVRDNYDSMIKLILLSDPTESQDNCNFEPLEFRYGLPDFNNNKLQGSEFLKLIRFVRLWKKLGWSIEDTDKAIAALYPANQYPTPDDNEATVKNKLDQGFQSLILNLANLQEVLQTLDLSPKKDLIKLLACWSNLDTHGTHSLYRQMFLNATILRLDDVFEEDGYGNYPKRNTEKIVEHQEALQAAFNITFEELELILKKLNFDEQTNLTLENLSAIFRQGYLAQKLKLSVWEFLSLQTMSGVDPFQPLQPVQPAILTFINLAQQIQRSPFNISELSYFLQHQDLSGKASPTLADIYAFAKIIRDDLIRINQEHLVENDPTGEVTRNKMTLVYGNAVTDTFFGLLNRSSLYSVPYNHSQPQLEEGISAVSNSLSYDHFQKQLIFRGVMTEATRTALKNVANISNEFQTAVDELFNQGQTEFQTFFDQFSDLKTLYDNYVASNLPIEQKLSNLLEDFLPALRQKLKRLQIKQTINAKVDAELAITNLLLETPEILHAVEQSDQAIIEDFLSLETQGVSVQYFFAEDVIGTPNLEELALPGIHYYPNGMSLPQNPEAPDTLISGVWRWLLEVPNNGFYNFYIETDADAEITLSLNDQIVEMQSQNGVWQNQQAIELKVGQLYTLTLIVKTVKNRLVFKWESQGIAKEAIPKKYLYSYRLLERFKNSYIRLLKILTIVEELQLSALELQYFATHPNYQINQESWLNALPVSPSSAPNTTALLTVFMELLDYTELKNDLKVQDDVLAKIFNNPNATIEEDKSLLSQVTGWDQESLNVFFAHFDLSITDLSELQSFIRVKDAFDLLKKLEIKATTLVASTTNEPTLETVEILQSGLRTRYDTTAWFTVIQPINDQLRNHQRDALVAFVLHQLQKTETTKHINTSDKLFEYFLIDVEMDACMKTSRIKQAISTVQLFIQRCLLNLEPLVASTSINANEWEWMKRYRVWEANRKVFLFPENWLEPELRDNKSPFFKDLESELLQSDITEETAAIALVHYLEKLDEVAKLEICGMYYEENQINKVADDIIHVIGRTSGAQRKYYYRRLEGISWTPWESIDLNIEDNPILPVVWKGRLFLFWLSVLQESPTDQTAPTTQSNTQITDLTASDLQGDVKVTVKLALYWSEYYNNKWQPPKTSDVNRPIYLSQFKPNHFNRLNLEMASSLGSSGELNINIRYQNRFNVYFKLYNTHSLPIGVGNTEGPQRVPSATGNDSSETEFFFLLLRSRTFRQDNNIFTIDYFDVFESNADERSFSQEILRNAVRYEILEPKHFVQDIFETPFFYQDPRHVFYVQPVESQITLFNFSDFGIATFPSVIIEAIIPPIVVKPEVINPLPKTIFFPPERVRPGLVNPRPVETFLDENIRVNQAVQSSGTIAYGDKLIGPGGSLDIAQFNSLNR